MRSQARVVIVGLSNKPLEIQTYTELLGNEVELIGSNDHHLQELSLLVEMARKKILDTSHVVTKTVPLDADAINKVLDDLETFSSDVRAVVVTGSGRGFCAGQDLREFSELPGSIGDALEDTYHPNVRLIRSLDKPVIAAVNGPAVGLGAEFTLQCDLRLAAPTEETTLIQQVHITAAHAICGLVEQDLFG